MRQILILLALFLVLGVYPSHGEREVLRIAYVDREAVFETPRVRKVIEALRGEVEAAQEEIRAMEGQLQEMRQQYETMQDMMTEQAAERRRAEIREQEEKFLQFGRDRLREIEEKREQQERTVTEEIREIVTEIALEEGHDLVLWKSAIAYAAEEVDLTEKVLKRFLEQSGEEEGGESQ